MEAIIIYILVKNMNIDKHQFSKNKIIMNYNVFSNLEFFQITFHKCI